MAQWYCLAPFPKVSPLSSYRTCGWILKYSNSLQWPANLTLLPSVDMLIWKGEKCYMRCGPWRSTEAFPVHSLLPKHHLVSRYTWERNFIYVHKKRTSLLSTVFTKLIHKRHNCVQISYTEIHPNSGKGGRGILRMNINIFKLLSNVFTDFYKSQNYSIRFCENIPFWIVYKCEKN
jgi:hypothetical protein